MQVESVTHQGLVRPNNEDRFLVRYLSNDSALLALADGMGGHAAGEVAAEEALKILEDFDFGGSDFASDLLHAVHDAQARVLEASRSRQLLTGMGTTLTSVLILEGTAHWVHIGDSRLYLFRSGILEQITDDHTIPGRLLKKGEISMEEARLHPYGNFLTSCIGCDNFDPDTGAFGVNSADLLMLSSDGLHDLVSHAEIAFILGQDVSQEEKLDRLVQRCLSAGGRDNITAILVRI